MKYITSKHDQENIYIQYEKNGDLCTIYRFKDFDNRKVLSDIIIFKKPNYFVLPYINQNPVLNKSDYVIDCSCFDELDNATIVCTGNTIKLVHNNHCSLNVVLAKGQSLYGITEKSKGIIGSNKPYGFLFIGDENMQEARHQEYLRGSFPKKVTTCVDKIAYGFSSKPEFDASAHLQINKLVVFNTKTQDCEKVVYSNSIAQNGEEE